MNISSVTQSFAAYPASFARQPVDEEQQDRFALHPAHNDKDDKDAKASADKSSSGHDLSEEETKEVEKLKARDREVRAHEMAHLAAAGGLANSGASFTYERGPDGVSYAIGGEVKIDTSKGSSPEDTMRRAQIIRAAALAPAEPSGQDRAVAAKAAQMEADARSELAKQDQEDEQNNNESAASHQQYQHAAQQYQSVANGDAVSGGFQLLA